VAPSHDVLLVTPGTSCFAPNPPLAPRFSARCRLDTSSEGDHDETNHHHGRAVAATRVFRFMPRYRRASGPQPDPFGRFLFPPELVMQTRRDQSARLAARGAAGGNPAGAIQVRRSAWRLSAEGRSRAVAAGPTPDEAQVLEQVDRIWRPKRGEATQIGLLVRIKNALTPVQQAKRPSSRTQRSWAALTPRPSGRAYNMNRSPLANRCLCLMWHQPQGTGGA